MTYGWCEVDEEMPWLRGGHECWFILLVKDVDLLISTGSFAKEKFG